MHDPEKSDSGIVATKPTNKAGRPVAEPVEPRPGTKGNADQQSTHRAQSRARVTQALGRVRLAARQRKKEQFTALLHHINVDTLRTAFYALKSLTRNRNSCIVFTYLLVVFGPCKTARQELDRCQIQPCLGAADRRLEVFCQPPVAAKPGDGSCRTAALGGHL